MIRISPLLYLLAVVLFCVSCNALGMNTVTGGYKPSQETSEAAEVRLKSKVDEASQSGSVEKHGTALRLLGDYYDKVGRYDEALAILQESLTILEPEYGRKSEQVAMSLGRMAAVYMNNYRFKEAEPRYQEALEFYRSDLDEYSKPFASTTANLGILYRRWGRPEKALKCYAEALELYSRLYGRDSVKIVGILNKFGAVYADLARFDESREMYSRGLRIHAENGIRNSRTAALLSNLAINYEKYGRYDEALKLKSEALTLTVQLYGENSLKAASAYSGVGTMLRKMGRYAEAEELILKNHTIRKALFGEDDANMADSYHNLGWLYEGWGRYADALKHYERALGIHERTYGKDSIELAGTMNNLADLHYKMGDYATAESMHRYLLKLRTSVYGELHPDVTQSLTNLADLYAVKGEYEQALHYENKALEIRRDIYGDESLVVGYSLSSVGRTLKKMGRYSEAEDLILKSYAIRKALFGEDDANVAGIHHQLGWLYQGWGKYAEALKHYELSLGMKERTYGKDNIQLAGTMNNLANTHRSMGNYATAESLHRYLLKLRTSVFGESHPDVAQSLFNLARLLSTQGEYEQALRHHAKALEMRREIFGEESLMATYSLSEIAWIENQLGNSTKALELLVRCHEIQKAILGEGHAEVVFTLNSIAAVHSENGQYDLALDIYRQTVAALEKIYGAGSPRIANSLNELGRTMTVLGRYGEAEAVLGRAMEIRANVFHENHPSIAYDLYAIAALEARQGKPRAAASFARASTIAQRNVDILAGTTAEDRLLKYLEKMAGGLSQHLSYALIDQGAAEAAMTSWLQRKGMALEAQRVHAIRESRQQDPAVAVLFRELQTVREKLSDYFFASRVGALSQQEREAFDQLTSRKRELERQIAETGVGGDGLPTRHTSASDVIASLPPRFALVDIARIPLHRFVKGEGADGPDHYLAFVVRHGSSQVHLVDLGKAEEIDGLVREMLSLVQGSAPAGFEAASESACRRIFEPLRPYLGDARTIYVSPDGFLNLVPFEVLREPGQGYLIDSNTFIYLGSGRDLLEFSIAAPSDGKAVLIGDPDFDMQIDTTGQAVNMAPMKGMYFNRLIGTRNEIEGISNILGRDRAEVYLGTDSTESVLRAVNQPKVLHLATHGFFLDRQAVGNIQWASRGIELSGRESLQVGSMFRSGLALAGANGAVNQGHSQGISTAEELMALDLRGTELVVLSACETGVGDVVNGQGVFGLRRAFVHAGARSLVMSMWNIPDQETEELMVDFYRRMEKGGSSRAEALRGAMLELREKVRNRYGSDNPFYWGSFVFMGNPE